MQVILLLVFIALSATSSLADGGMGNACYGETTVNTCSVPEFNMKVKHVRINGIQQLPDSSGNFHFLFPFPTNAGTISQLTWLRCYTAATTNSMVSKMSCDGINDLQLR